MSLSRLRLVVIAVAGLLSVGGALAWFFLVYDTAAGRCQRGDLEACIVLGVMRGQEEARHALQLVPSQQGSSTTVVMLGQSMWPTLTDGDTVQVNTRAYLQDGPQRGDIIVFKPPNVDTRDFIKRVIAIPGDRLRIVQGTVYINGEVLKEPYLPEKWTYKNTWPPDGRDVLVPTDLYFVMGDNRNHSSDSRTFGFVSLDSILERVVR